MGNAEMITTLAGVESVVNSMARKAASKKGIRSDIFTIHLVRKMRHGYMDIHPGPHVEINLLWPYGQEYLNTHIDGMLRAISKFKLYTPLVPATHHYFRTEKSAANKWIREKLGDGAADMNEAWLPRHRITTKIITTIEVIDKVTGLSEALTSTEISDSRKAPTVLWSVLSQKVFDKEDHDEPELPTVSETPLLDAALKLES